MGVLSASVTMAVRLERISRSVRVGRFLESRASNQSEKKEEGRRKGRLSRESQFKTRREEARTIHDSQN